MKVTNSTLAEVAAEMDSGVVGYLTASAETLLRERVESAVADVPFYKQLYQDYLPVPGDARFMTWFDALPVLTKSQLQRAGPAGLINQQYNRRRLVEKPTSGSTGVPFTLYLERSLIDFRKWRMQRPFQRVVGERPGSLVFLFPWDFVSRSAATGSADLGSARIDSTDTSDGGPDIEASIDISASLNDAVSKTVAAGHELARQIKQTKKVRATKQSAPSTKVVDRPITVNAWFDPEKIYEILKEIRPSALIGFASTIGNLASWMVEDNLYLTSVQQVWTTSEILSPHGFDSIRSALQCVPLAIYASNEFGFMGWQERDGGPIILDSDHLYFQFVEPDQPLNDGHCRRKSIVITDLLNDTTPLIRYNIEDIAVPAEPVVVEADRSFTAIAQLEGKEADVVQTASGSQISPFQILGAVRDALPHAQYRVIVADSQTVILQYRPGAGFSADNLAAATAAIKQVLGDEITVFSQEVLKIEREPTGKLRPLVNLSSMALGARRKLVKKLELEAYVEPVPTGLVKTIVEKCISLSTLMQRPETVYVESSELYADVGIDSLRFLKLIARLEEQLGLEINDEDLLDHDIVTIADLQDFVTALVDERYYEM